MISIAQNVADAYVHAGGQCEWDSAARSSRTLGGLHTSRIDGRVLVYNQADPMLPDLLVCRPELASTIVGYVQRDQLKSSVY